MEKHMSEILTPKLATSNYLSLVSSGHLLPLRHLNKIVVAFSGGKDSLALVLMLKEMGVPNDMIELQHHLIDPPNTPKRFDWPCTEAYVRAVARDLGIPVRFSWKEGGFEGELFREKALTGGVFYEDGDGCVQYLPPDPGATFCKECRFIFYDDEILCPECGELRDGYSTRLKYPMVTADLAKRWCSAYLKIQVCRRVINNDPRFANGYYWILSGERRQESKARAKYKEAEKHACCNKRRTVHQWRAVIDWTEQQVWEIIERHRIRPHPAYYLGWGRVSCMCCIFGDRDQWASIKHIAPDMFDWHAKNERRFSLTIKQGESVVDQANRGNAFVEDAPDWLIDQAMSEEYTEDVVVPKGEQWLIPAGAYKRCGGPT
jgi:3'-phosphoadenosine 5'-phosphosulfate sulfotransferase (PAPS reductase)/FAD synthetase